MRIFLLTILGIVMYAFSGAQVKKIKYYKYVDARKEVNAKKGKYVQTITQNPDGSITTEYKHIAKNEVIRSETYKGGVAYGIWINKNNGDNNELDYNFDVEYVDDYCNDTVPGLKSIYSNNDGLQYISPIIKGNISYLTFLLNTLRFPPLASAKGTSGRVVLAYTITENGTIENIVVLKVANIHLDKEAVRIIRKLQFTSPPLLNGQPKRICVKAPLTFNMQ